MIESGTMSKKSETYYYLRDAVGAAIMSLADENSRVVFVSANVMSSCRVLGSVEKYPKRSFNVGIAEQNMISFSAGLAREGLLPFAFTMAPFMSMRACEQVRTDVAYNNLNVRMIAPYAGVSGGISGATHWAIEDCAIMSGIPGMTILEPCDPIQAKKMIEATIDYVGPIYMRIGIEGVTSIYSEKYDYQIGKADILSYGNDGAYICSGVIVKYALQASERIYKETGKKITVIDMHTVKPIDVEAVSIAARTGNVIVAQDHNIIGGLGNLVASVIMEKGYKCNYKTIGIPDKFVVMAHAPFLYHKYGLDADGLYNSMKNMLFPGKNI